MDENKRIKISKHIAYLLRHDPSGLEISEEGFTDLEHLLEKLRERWPRIGADDVREIVERDPKGRYEIKNDKIRARYGHSIDVDPDLTTTDQDTLYHGTTSDAAENILEDGLKSKGRQKVHLSRNIEDAIKVGKRRTENPTVLEIDASNAIASGIRIERASDAVYVAEEIPSEYISVLERESI